MSKVKSLTEEIFVPIKLVIKDEHEGGGPLWKVDKNDIWRNYKDANMKDFQGNFYPVWFTLHQARVIAKQLKLPLEES